MADALLTHYQTKDGDVLDQICRIHYANVDQALDAVLAANPGLSSCGSTLPAGVLICLPDMDTNELSVIRLWS